MTTRIGITECITGLNDDVNMACKAILQIKEQLKQKDIEISNLKKDISIFYIILGLKCLYAVCF